MITTGIIDRDKHKPFNNITALQYLDGHQGIRARFLNEKVRKQDQAFVTDGLLEFPVFFANILKLNYEIHETQRVKKITEKLMKEGMITIMLGGKRQGKTAATYWFVEKIIEEQKKEAHKKNLYWFGFSPEVERVYPELQQTMDMRRVEDGILFYDETMLTFLGRDAMTTESKDKVKLLPTIGHRDLSVMFLSQSTRIDAIILNLANSFWFKPYAAMDFDKDDRRQRRLFRILRFFMPKQKHDNIFFDMDTNESYLFQNTLPHRWTEGLSKPFSIIREKKQALRYRSMMEEALLTDRTIKIFLEQRGWSYNDLL